MESEFTGKFFVYRDNAGEYRARFQVRNETMFLSEGYKHVQSALNAIAALKAYIGKAQIEYSNNILEKEGKDYERI